MKNQKYGTLYLIPVTLGESVETLPDYTLRTASLLRVFIVEDIRSARRFLRAAGYTGDYSEIIFHVLNEHTAPEEIPGMLEQILNGTDTGLMSQAGAPCVADPGALIVSAAHSLNISVKPMVGPSSVLLALMASGFNGQNFMFHGYLPVKKNARIQKIREIETESYRRDQTQIFIEAPYRNMQLLNVLLQTCKDNTRLCIASDLTSPAENIKTQTVADWKKSLPEINKVPAVFLLYHG